jgi:hypothetical protein
VQSIELNRRAFLASVAAATVFTQARAANSASRYTDLTAGIVHFFGFGQSLSDGHLGVPILSATQPTDNLMIGEATRALNNQARTPVSIHWLPIGPANADGTYPFNPMIATPEIPSSYMGGESFPEDGETPSEGAINFFRREWLLQRGLTADPSCRFVVTNCGEGSKTIAQLSDGATPDIFNRLRDAATQVRATATALGLTYQVGGVIFSQGEGDVAQYTSYASYLSSLQALQQSFLSDIVVGIGGQPPGTVVPWFVDQPDAITADRTTAVHQALLDWSVTPNSDCYLAGPVYQYPDHSIHLTANGYRWHGKQVAKAMIQVLLNGAQPRPLYMLSAQASGTAIMVNLSVPVPPIRLGDAYVQYTKTNYPDYGFILTDASGLVPITSVTIVGPTSIQIVPGRRLAGAAVLQAGYNLVEGTDWGTNICDSDASVSDDPYVYTAGVQESGEDIATWNGADLIGQPYPLANYLAVGQVKVS